MHRHLEAVALQAMSQRILHLGTRSAKSMFLFFLITYISRKPNTQDVCPPEGVAGIDKSEQKQLRGKVELKLHGIACVAVLKFVMPCTSIYNYV